MAAIIFTIIVIIVVFRILEFYMPRITQLIHRTTPKLHHEVDDFIENLWGMIWGTVKPEQKVVKQEIHHHYSPQYDHSQHSQNIHKTTNISNSQTISDSVYYSKGQTAGGGDSPGRIPEVGISEEEGSCSNCGTALQEGWNVCPVCANPTSVTHGPEY